MLMLHMHQIWINVPSWIFHISNRQSGLLPSYLLDFIQVEKIYQACSWKWDHGVSDAFDMAFLLKFDLKKFLWSRLLLRMVTNSKSILMYEQWLHVQQKKRFTVDIQTFRNADQSFETTDFDLVRSEFNIAHVLAKNKAQHITKEGFLDRKPDHST